MKPNLFRSINNALAERFPLLPRIRRSFYGLLSFSIVFLLLLVTRENIHTAVVPVKETLSEKTVAFYGSDTIRLQGELIISNPTALQKVLLTDTTMDIDIISLIFMGVISIIIVRIIPKIYQQNLFRRDVSNSIKAIGYMMFLHVILRVLTNLWYAPGEIVRLTHNEFTTHRTFPVWLYAEGYTALLILAIGSAYKRGVLLQQEQDLTV